MKDIKDFAPESIEPIIIPTVSQWIGLKLEFDPRGMGRDVPYKPTVDISMEGDFYDGAPPDLYIEDPQEIDRLIAWLQEARKRMG